MFPTDLRSAAEDSPRQSVSRRRVEIVISRSVAGFGLIFAAQAVPLLLEQFSLEKPIWSYLTVIALYGALILAAVCSGIRRFVVGSHRIVAGVYAVALATWPFFLAQPGVAQQGDHWLYLLTTVATSSAAFALPLRTAMAYLLVIPSLYGVIRGTEAGGSGPWELGAFNAIYSILLGGAVLVLITLVRSASSSVDQAQATALNRYSTAVHRHATEAERVQVDAIVHDSVLTAFLTAARAETAEQRRLASTMASDAMRHLDEAALSTPDDDRTVPLSDVVDRIVQAARAFSTPFSVQVRALEPRMIPAAHAETLHAAAVQAMVNSIQHAGGPEVRRWLRVTSDRDGAVTIEVGDDGAGFVLEDVPAERLGVRRSIIERMAGAGGSATVRTAPGRGAVVRLRWPVEET
jgi:signal transduction histidine kinase